MDTFLSKGRWKLFLIYIDEVFTFSKAERQNVNNIGIERSSTRIDAHWTIKSSTYLKRKLIIVATYSCLFA